jgi:hypothetical protein
MRVALGKQPTKEIIMSIVADAVAKGADVLDTYEPDWAENVNVDALDLSEPDFCVLGQTFYGRSLSGADYSFGLDVLAAAEGYSDTFQFAADHGFDHHNMHDLQRLWSHQIAVRT